MTWTTLVNRIYAAIFQDASNSNLWTFRTTARGTFTPDGMTDLKTTTMTIGTTATKIPATPWTGRKSMRIHNKSDSTILYFGKSNVVASDALGNDSGAEIAPTMIENVDFAADTDIYGVVASGSITIKVVEYK